jgi:two-component system response regulator FixJ
VSPQGAEHGLVYVVDDEPDVRGAVSLLLRSVALQAVTFPDAASFLGGYAAQPSPACALLDLRMPGMCGLEVFQELKARGCTMPVVMITAHGEVGVAVRAMKAGAFDFVEKPFRGNDLIETVHHALRSAAHDMHRTAARVRIRARFATLTPREREVMGHVVQGAANKAIGRTLGLSVRTVELHRARVLEKMGAPTLTDLVRMSLVVDAP